MRKQNVHVLSEYVFCPRAAVLADGRGDDTGEEERELGPKLGSFADFDEARFAELLEEEVYRLFPEALPQLTPNTLRTREQLMEELKRVKAEGVAFDREEHTVGICAVGAAVHDHRRERAAITIPVPSIRFYGNERKLAQALQNTCEKIRQSLTASL